jgi:23S rRNA pseudouridine1911/1915/1917 synthase
MAFVWGAPNRKTGTINEPIDRHPHNREKMAVRQGGREAVTHWEVLETFTGKDGKPVASLLACQLETGRTHQIRVHLAHLGHPLLGDDVYGSGFKTKARQLGPESQKALTALAGRPCMPTSWFWNTRAREKFSTGNPACRRIWFCLRPPSVA